MDNVATLVEVYEGLLPLVEHTHRLSFTPSPDREGWNGWMIPYPCPGLRRQGFEYAGLRLRVEPGAIPGHIRVQVLSPWTGPEEALGQPRVWGTPRACAEWLLTQAKSLRQPC